MPRYVIAVLSGTLLAWYGNELPDPFWLAYLPLALLLAFASPGWRCLWLAAAAYLWSAAIFMHGLDVPVIWDRWFLMN